MKIHNFFFWAACFFLIGILIASLTQNLSVGFYLATLFGFFITAILLFLEKGLWAILAVFIILGSIYYFVYDFYQQAQVFEFNKKIALPA